MEWDGRSICSVQLGMHPACSSLDTADSISFADSIGAFDRCGCMHTMGAQENGVAGVGIWCAVFGGTFLGGLSLRLPATKIQVCISALEKEEGGCCGPWDGIDDVDFDATLHSRLFQMVHGSPGATIGTGSWPLQEVPGVLLRDLGWEKAVGGTGTLDVARLARWGYRWAIVDGRASKTMRMRAHDDVFCEHLWIDVGILVSFAQNKTGRESGAPFCKPSSSCAKTPRII